MAQQEQTLWDTLELMHGRIGGWTTTEPNKEPTKKVVKNGIDAGSLKKELVLKYRPSDIEDTIYFMEHRDYFSIHSSGVFTGLIVYGLTDKALGVLRDGVLPKEERTAFREALWDLKPRIWGVSPNIPEIVRRAKKVFKKQVR